MVWTHLYRSRPGHLRRAQPTFFFSGFRTALAGVHSPGLVVSPTGGILSSPQNFNFVCSRCVAAGAEELKPRLNMQNKRPANRLRVGRGGGGGGGGGQKTVSFFSWIGDLIHRRVKQPAKNGIMSKSNDNNRNKRADCLITNRCLTLFKGGIKSEKKIFVQVGARVYVWTSDGSFKLRASGEDDFYATLGIWSDYSEEIQIISFSCYWRVYHKACTSWGGNQVKGCPVG